MAGSRFYLVREHFTNPAGVHTSSVVASGSDDGVFVVASAAAAERAWRVPYHSVEFGVLDIVVSTSSTALSTGNTLDDAAMSKTGCRVSGMQRPGDGFSRGALYERRGRNDAQKIAHEFLFGCL